MSQSHQGSVFILVKVNADGDVGLKIDRKLDVPPARMPPDILGDYDNVLAIPKYLIGGILWWRLCSQKVLLLPFEQLYVHPSKMSHPLLVLNFSPPKKVVDGSHGHFHEVHRGSSQHFLFRIDCQSQSTPLDAAWIRPLMT